MFRPKKMAFLIQKRGEVIDVKRILALLLTLVIVVAFAGCGKEDVDVIFDSKVCGTFDIEGGTVGNSGTVKVSGVVFGDYYGSNFDSAYDVVNAIYTYKRSGNKLSLTRKSGSGPKTFSGTYNSAKNTFVLDKNYLCIAVPDNKK